MLIIITIVYIICNLTSAIISIVASNQIKPVENVHSPKFGSNLK